MPGYNNILANCNGTTQQLSKTHYLYSTGNPRTSTRIPTSNMITYAFQNPVYKFKANWRRTLNALSKRRHSVWPTSWNMLWSFNISKSILDTPSVQFVWWKKAIELILISTILQLWGWLYLSRTPSRGFTRRKMSRLRTWRRVQDTHLIYIKVGGMLLQKSESQPTSTPWKYPKTSKTRLLNSYPEAVYTYILPITLLVVISQFESHMH
jgi:hypothetical protein